MNFLITLLLFVIGIFSLLITIRALMQFMRVNALNPVAQAVIKATDPTLRPLRRFVGQVRNVDVAAVIVCLALESVQNGIMYGFGLSSVLASPIDVIDNVVKILIVLMIVRIVFSFIPVQSSGWTSLIVDASNIVLRPFRNFNLQIGPFDLTPGIILILLFFLSTFLGNAKLAFVL